MYLNQFYKYKRIWYEDSARTMTNTYSGYMFNRVRVEKAGRGGEEGRVKEEKEGKGGRGYLRYFFFFFYKMTRYIILFQPAK